MESESGEDSFTAKCVFFITVSGTTQVNVERDQ